VQSMITINCILSCFSFTSVMRKLKAILSFVCVFLDLKNSIRHLQVIGRVLVVRRDHVGLNSAEKSFRSLVTRDEGITIYVTIAGRWASGRGERSRSGVQTQQLIKPRFHSVPIAATDGFVQGYLH